MRYIFLLLLYYLFNPIEASDSVKESYKPLLIPHDNDIMQLEYKKIEKRLSKQQATSQAALQSVIAIIEHLDCYKVNCTKRGWLSNEYAIGENEVNFNTLCRCLALKNQTGVIIKRKFTNIIKEPMIDDITGDDSILYWISIIDYHKGVDERLNLIKENSKQALRNINNGSHSKDEIAKILMRHGM